MARGRIRRLQSPEQVNQMPCSQAIWVRRMRRADIGPVAGVHVVAGTRAYQGRGPKALDQWIEEFASEEHILEALRGSQVGLVAVRANDDTVVGSVFVGDAVRGPDVISGLYVSEESRGIGTVLLHEAIGWLRGARPRSARAFVMVGNDSARGFFEWHGFSAGNVVPSKMFRPHGMAHEMSLSLRR